MLKEVKMTKEDRKNTKIRMGNLELEASRSLLEEYDYGNLCISQLLINDDDSSKWVIADILLDKDGEPYLKSVGDRIFDERINMDDFIKLAKIGFTLEKTAYEN